LERGHERGDEELVDGDRPLALGPASLDRGAHREQRRAPVALRVGVRERPADRAQVAHDRVGDLRRGIAERAEPAA
jgi:hypothetical protein